jgi:hypothetical protein
MSKISFDSKTLVRIGTYTVELERHHLWGTDDDIDREFNSVCRAIWAYTLDDFDDDSLSQEDHDWLDELSAPGAYQFAAENGYDLGDYANGEIVSDWWGVYVDDPRGETRPAHAGATGIGLEKTRRAAVSAREGYRRGTIALLESTQVNREWRPLANSDI